MSLLATATPVPKKTITPHLTTEFVPASTCFGSIINPEPPGLDSTYWLSFEGTRLLNYVDLVWGVSADCYPPAFWALADTTTMATWIPTEPVRFFSPGICPSAFQNALQTTGDGVTTGYCCPTGFQIGANISLCTTNTKKNSWTNMTFVNNLTTTTSASVWAQAFATPIVIQWASTDLSLLAAATPTTSPNTSLFTKKSGLSEGAKAGIGVGAALGCILLAGAIGFWLLRLKRRSKGGPHDDSIIKAELHGDGVDESKPHFEELGEHELYEAGGLHKPPEMDSMNVRAELEGDWHGYEANTEHR